MALNYASKPASLPSQPSSFTLLDIEEQEVSRTSEGSFESDSPAAHDLAFWLVFLGIFLSAALTAFEVSSVATALPTITHDLNGTSFIWIGSAYTLAATAFVPLCGGLAQVYGRRALIFGSLFLMTVGSALCGAATNMTFLIAARTIQGLGGGGISAANAIIISDLVSLKERGLYNGLVSLAWATASGTGPLIGGSLAQTGNWRWIFYLNIPVCGVSAVLFAIFLRVKNPPGNWKHKLASIDWVGNVIVVAATTACCIALAWSGVEHAWDSAAVLVPLLVGLASLVLFVVYEARFAQNPLVPVSLVSTLTGISGYIQTFIASLVMLGDVYYVPVFFQACKGASPIGAGVDQLSYTTVAVISSVISGVSVKKLGKYRPQLWLCWVFVVIGHGLFSTLDADSSRGRAIGYLAVPALGIGALLSTLYFPVLAPLPISSNGPALALFHFLRNFSQVWGITIGGAILQNQLQHRIPQELLQQPQIAGTGNALVYATIPFIGSLPSDLKQQVQVAFAGSLRIVWLALLGIAGIGAVASLFMKDLKLHTEVYAEWDLQREGSGQASALEKGTGTGETENVDETQAA